MQEDPTSPCGHENPPSAHFCDVCGARLPMPCPRCSAINRGHANFCSNCGIDLRDATPTHATPSTALVESAQEESPASVPAKRVVGEGGDFGEAERLEQIRRFFARQQRPRRPPVWLGIAAASAAATVVFGVLGVFVFRIYMGTPDTAPPSFVDTRAQARMARPDESASSSVAHSAVSAPVRPDDNESSPAAAATDTSSAAAPSQARAGGGLIFVVPGEPPSYDAHREETFALIHPAAPHYNTLLRIDPTDPTGTRVVGDLATSWTVSSDKRTYVLRLRRGVKFHDGSEMTSRDVRATYEKIINPPPGITSARKGEY